MENILSNDIISAIIAFGLVLIPAIIVHELGHFFAAKMVGINVLEFGIGFPPRMVRLFTWGETEFTLNWIPLGGYVRPLGESMIGPNVPEEGELSDLESDFSDEEKPKNTEFWSEREELIARGVPEEKLKSVNDAKPLGRAFFMAAGAFSNFVSAIVLFMIAALIGLPEIVGERMQVYTLPEDSALAQAGIVEGDAIEQINGELFLSTSEFFEKFSSDEDGTVDLLVRSLETDEPYEITVSSNTYDAQGAVLVVGVLEDMPAAAAGVEENDIILAANGTEFGVENPSGDLIELLAGFAGEEVTLTILRGDWFVELSMTPLAEVEPGKGRIGLGIGSIYRMEDDTIYALANPQIEFIPRSLGDSISYGFSRTASTFGQIAAIPAQIIEGTISPEQARPVSIIGVSQIGGQIFQSSVSSGNASGLLEFIALVSIFLGITNLLPFPPLDGGRILFILIEVVRGKPVPPEVENRFIIGGMLLLLGLGIIVIIYDLFNPLIIQ